MLLFVVGLIIIVFGVITLLNTLNMFFLLVFAIGLLVAVISAFQPLSGWGKPKVKTEYLLVPLVPNSNFYLCRDLKGNVVYRFKRNGVSFIEIRSNSDVVIEEIKGNQLPMIKEAIVNPKRSLWAFPILSSKYVYILQIPKDSILK